MINYYLCFSFQGRLQPYTHTCLGGARSFRPCCHGFRQIPPPRSVDSMICKPSPQQDDDGEEEGSGLFHARVLLAEAEPRSAKKIKETLEQAGYMVTVEGDGKQVRELGVSRRGANIVFTAMEGQPKVRGTLNKTETDGSWSSLPLNRE